ncbi:hypothetical protein BCR39DRAFT_390569 [Naematelia encephala]|uniref:Zn(2)-C6 fungal-type domain-containing protein n=1 Tax=Naematelia encephala TaxID=71784 RepID=A0A1Y2AHV4_9TREE|nr:hypothetical protein BCR39DRAFT_390569 [Naematelia encephala]
MLSRSTMPTGTLVGGAGEGDESSRTDEGMSHSRTKLACKTCRANKVRCVRPREPHASCARCSRYGLLCVDPLSKAKGRPPNSPGLPLSPHPNPESTSGQGSSNFFRAQNLPLNSLPQRPASSLPMASSRR